MKDTNPIHILAVVAAIVIIGTVAGFVIDYINTPGFGCEAHETSTELVRYKCPNGEEFFSEAR